MNQILKITLLLSFIIFGSSISFARDSFEAQLLLREAMMESNADYNKHKKKSNQEEFDREGGWNERDVTTIVIGSNKSPEANQDLAEFTQENEDFDFSDRDISSNDDSQVRQDVLQD